MLKRESACLFLFGKQGCYEVICIFTNNFNFIKSYPSTDDMLEWWWQINIRKERGRREDGQAESERIDRMHTGECAVLFFLRLQIKNPAALTYDLNRFPRPVVTMAVARERSNSITMYC